VLDALVTDVVETRRAIAALQARESQLLADAVDLALARDDALRREGRRRGADLPMREISAELAAAMRLSDRAVQQRMGDAAVLGTRFPATLAAWADGRVDAGHVSAVLDAGSAIDDDETRARFETLALGIAQHESPARTRAHLRAVAAQLDPEAAARRHRRAHDERAVRVVDLDDSLARVIADVPPVLAHAILDRLTEMARDVRDAELACAAESASTDAAAGGSPEAIGSRAPGGASGEAGDPSGDGSTARFTTGPSAVADGGDPALEGERWAAVRTLDQIRADVFADLLLAGSPTAHGEGDALSAVVARVQVTVPVLSLMGLDAGPALLAGVGPIDIDTARRLAARAPGWDRVLTHPHTGMVLAVDRYRPSSDLRRFLAARDEHCRFPGCRRPARRSEIDHTVDAALGGETCESNLAHLCTRHHTLKHATAWTVRRLEPGVLEWSSPTGRKYPDRPPGVVRFVPSEWIARIAAIPEAAPF
jgi:hypothetical protein